MGITEEKRLEEKTPQQKFVEALLASQSQRVKDAQERGIHVVSIKKEDLIGLVFYENELIMISREDLDTFNFPD